jgi:phosphonate transport system substrate-binding protein
MKALVIAIPLLLAAETVLVTGGPAVAGSPVGAQPGSPLEKGILSLGSISLTPKQETAKFQPLADYLARRMAVAGITRGRVVVAGSMAEMAELVNGKQVDIYIDSPFPVAVVSMKTGAQPFLRRWKGGKGDYHSLLFVRKDARIATMRDLRGRMVALKDPFSTSGYLLPKATLMQAGMALTKYTDPSAKVPPGEIGYVFANSEENIMVWVLRGKVPAGAMSEEEFTRLVKNRKGELKILLRTLDVPRHVVAHRADMPTRVLIALEESLLGMDANDEGKRVLEGFENTAKFDRFPRGAAQAFGPIEALTRMVETELGN